MVPGRDAYGASISAWGVGLTGSSAFSSNMEVDWQMGTAFSDYYLFGHSGNLTNAPIVYS
jgi:hypothetical protein